MSCEHLVCAACAGPVIEGRCATCRAARARAHGGAPFALTPQMIAFLIVALVLIATLASQLH
jgi:hypothetical protein